jgi:N-acetyl-alpha-D-glucosaminyl L-malate synthase BshA
MKKLKIGIVLYPTFGGSGVLATELGLALAKKGHQIHFISYNQPARLDNYIENVFYHEVLIPAYPLFEFAPYEVALTSKLVNVTLNEGLDIIHAHYAIPHASAAYMAKQILLTHGINVPIVCTLHGTDITLVGRDSSYKPVITFAINHSDAVTAVSQSLKDDTLNHFDITKEIQVIYNFIDTSKYIYKSDECIKKRIAPDGEKLIMHMSNFRPVKRIPDIIKAFDIIRKTIPSKLIMIGDGPERPAAEDLANQLGISEHVNFIGKIKSAEQILPCGDLYFLPSDSESFGLSSLEAMASAVPVISTNAGGVPEVMIQGRTGFMSNVGDYEDMAKNAIYILEDENRFQEFRKNAKEHAFKFDISNILPQYEDLYTRLAESNI